MATEVDDAIREVLRTRGRGRTGLTSNDIYEYLSSEAHEHLSADRPYFSLVAHLAHMVRRGELTSNGPKGQKTFMLAPEYDPEPQPQSRYDRLMGDDELDLAGV